MLPFLPPFFPFASLSLPAVWYISCSFSFFLFSASPSQPHESSPLSPTAPLMESAKFSCYPLLQSIRRTGPERPSCSILPYKSSIHEAGIRSLYFILFISSFSPTPGSSSPSPLTQNDRGRMEMEVWRQMDTDAGKRKQTCKVIFSLRARANTREQFTLHAPSPLFGPFRPCMPCLEDFPVSETKEALKQHHEPDIDRVRRIFYLLLAIVYLSMRSKGITTRTKHKYTQDTNAYQVNKKSR